MFRQVPRQGSSCLKMQPVSITTGVGLDDVAYSLGRSRLPYDLECIESWPKRTIVKDDLMMGSLEASLLEYSKT